MTTPSSNVGADASRGHTQWGAEWERGDKEIEIVSYSEGVVIAQVDYDDVDHLEAEANARLIAAAPELLEALEECVAFTGAHGGPFAKARAAIAKARTPAGETK